MITRRTAFIIVTLIAALIGLTVSAISYNQQKSALLRSAFNRLELFHHLRKTALEDFLTSRSSDLLAMSRNKFVRVAMSDFSNAWREMGTKTAVLPRLYIDENRFPIGEKEKLNDAGDGSSYSTVHRTYHPWSTKFIKHFGYYDMFLIDPGGNIVYTVEKEIDFATNLNTGPYADTGLAFVFKQAIKHTGDVVTSDFRFYAPSNGDPAAFAGKAIRDETGKLLGVFAAQLPAEPINDLLLFSEGMGVSGETYTVGEDYLMRSQSRFIKETSLLKQKVETPAVIAGLRGKSGAQIISDYRNISVLSVYAPLDHDLGSRWVLLAEIDEAEVLGKLSPMLAALIGLVTFMASFLAVYFLMFTTPLRARIQQEIG